MIKFRKWLEARGTSVRVAKEFGVSRHCIRSWIRGDFMPRTDKIALMISKSKGELSFKDFFGVTAKKKAKKKK